MLKADIKEIAGQGQEGVRFMKQMDSAIKSASAEIREGGDLTKAWSLVFESLMEKPSMLHTNLKKVAEIFSKIGRHVGYTDGRLSDASISMGELAKSAKDVAKAVEGKDIQNMDDALAAIASGPKAGKMAALPPVADQYKRAEQLAKDYKKRLEKIITTPGYKAAGAPKVFEPQQVDIVDPDTNKVIQKITISAKRMGKTIVTSMKQAGAASNNLGVQMRGALRRVVQWGFASGIVYGLVRAFRNAGQVITEVQTKIVALQKVMNVSITDFEKMQDAASGMAQQYGIAIEEVLDGMVVYAQQGLSMAKINERTKATLLAVNVTTLSATEATEALTAAHKVFRDAVSGSIGYVDAWGAVAAKHAITAKDLALAVQRSGAAAKTAGVDFNDFLGIVTAIGAVTRQTGKEVATSTKFMFRAMRRPTATKQMLGLGIKGQDIAGNMRPAMDILGDLAGAWGKMSRAQQLSTAQAMAGIRHYNSFIVLMENWEEALSASEDAQNSQGFAARKNALSMQTFSKQMQILKETTKNLALSFGKAILPMATAGITAVSGLVSVFNKIPDILKQIIVLGGGATVAMVRTADFAVDTADAMFGGGIGTKVKEKGLLKSGLGAVKGMAKGAVGAFAGMGGALGGTGRMAQIATDDFASSTDIAKSVNSMGALSKAVYGVRTSFMAASIAAKTLMLATGAGLVVALGLTAYSMINARKTGEEMEDQLFDQIAVTDASVNAMTKQGSAIKSLGRAWESYSNALEVAADPEKLKIALDESNFKSPLKALYDYEEALYDTGIALAELNPSSIEGIGESGEYIYAASEAMEVLTMTAADAGRATMAAMNIKIIKAYGEEITKAQGAWGKFMEMLPGDTDMSLLGDLKQVRGQINKLAAKRKDLAGSGVTTLHLQGRLNNLVGEELELRGEMLAIAGDMQRIMNQMPIFNSESLAALAINSKELTESLQVMAQSGMAGKDATSGSLRMQYMARNVGLGGMISGDTTSDADRLKETLLEKGLKISTGALKGKGDLGILDPETAKQLLLVKHSLDELGDPSVVERARTVAAGMNEATGEMIYFFEDAVTGLAGVIRESELSPALAKAMKSIRVLKRSDLEAAGERTRKLLTSQSAGALAGVRIPEGGMPQIGPGMRREFSIEQRVMGDLPDEMERMSAVQRELSVIQKKYNEELTEGVENTETSIGSLKSNINVLPLMMEKLAMSLQLENFDLSKLAHMSTALAKLQQSLEQAAVAARDARIEEEATTELLKHQTGSLAGLMVAPALEMGKQLRELSGQERLQREMPGLGGGFRAMGAAQARYTTGIQNVSNIRKQKVDFGEMLRDLTTGGEELTQSQKDSFAARIEGISEGDMKQIDAIQKASAEQLGELQRQTPVLDKILIAMGATLESVGAVDPEAKKRIAQKGLASIEGANLVKMLGKVSADSLDTFIMAFAGVKERAESRKMGFDRYEVTTGNVDWQSEENRKAGESIARKIEATLEEMNFNKMRGQAGLAMQASGIPILSSMGGFVGMGASESSERYEGILRNLGEALMQFPELQDTARDQLTAMIERETKTKAEIDLNESMTKRQDLINKLKQKQLDFTKQITNAEHNALKDIQGAADIMKAQEGYKMAFAAQDLVNSMEGAILEFKKSEMMFYEMEDSDLTGPFARVGQPGFKTSFEQRKEEIDSKYGIRGGPGKAEELAKLEFDEKEAKIKQKQERETKALKEQQGQAEKLRGILSDAMLAGNLSPESQATARSYFDTLTSELSESEQAKMVGGELQYKGVGSLGQAGGFIAKMQQQAKDQAAEANAKLMVMTGKEVVSGLEEIGWEQLRATEEQTAVIRDSHAAKSGAMVSALGSSAVAGSNSPNTLVNSSGIRAVGKSNKNALNNIGAKNQTGNASATTSSILNTAQGPGSTAAARTTDSSRLSRGFNAGERTAAPDQTAALEELNIRIGELATKLGGFAEVVPKLDEVKAEITRQGESDQPVTIAGDVSISADSTRAIGDAASAPATAAIEAVGSDVALQNLRLEEARGEIDITNDRVSEEREAMESKLVLAEEMAAAAELAAADALRQAEDSLMFANEVNDLQSEFFTRVEAAEVKTEDVITNAELARAAAEDALNKSVSAETKAEVARLAIEREQTNRESGQRAVEDRIGQQEVRSGDLLDNIKDIQKKAEIALNVSKDASQRAWRR